MKTSDYAKVCFWTEQRGDHVLLRNVYTGELAFSVGCTRDGSTVQVRLTNGEFDSWLREECAAVTGTGMIH